MIKKNIDVSVGEEGARPIAMLVQLASQFKSNIELRRDNMTVNAKSIMGMMALGMGAGESVQVTVNGEDEVKAMEAIEKYLKSES